jgi:putative glutamine amidotransferase
MPIIAITRSSKGKYPLYGEWLGRINSAVTILELECEKDPIAALRRCDGFLLPGGADVDPAYFGKESERDACRIEAERDALEFSCIAAALEQSMPILGICRGLQIMNVFLGGSLITHLPGAGRNGHGQVGKEDATHAVRIRNASSLASIVGATAGEVNSAHHQAADRIAESLAVTAESEDGVVEGLEWKDSVRKSYLQLVQWHPERMPNPGSPFSERIASDFLRAVLAK